MRHVRRQNQSQNDCNKTTSSDEKLAQELNRAFRNRYTPFKGAKRYDKASIGEDERCQEPGTGEASSKTSFATKYHALVEFVECIVPIIFGIYVTALVHLKNAAYFPETRLMTSGRVQTMANNILLYAGLEVVSFIGLHYAIKQKFGFSPAYMLAFVLERQWVEFQARVIVWLTFVLMLTLQHFGIVLLACIRLQQLIEISFDLLLCRCRLHTSIRVGASLALQDLSKP